MMRANEIRDRLCVAAVDLGWTPPGWREPRDFARPRLVDVIGDLAARLIGGAAARP